MSALADLFNNLITSGFERFNKYYSVYRGFVVDNNDPKSFNRLQLKVPEIYGEYTMTEWAWPRNNYSGKNYGSQVIPEKKDVVWVEFEKGDPRKPIWSLGHPIKADDKADELKAVDTYWFKTPKGHSILIDDGNNKITVNHKDGAYIILNKTGISLKADKVSLGDEDGSDEPAVLGDKTETLFNDILSELITLLQTLQTIGTSDAASASSNGLTYASQLTASIPNILIKLNLIKAQQTKGIKSNNTSLN